MCSTTSELALASSQRTLASFSRQQELEADAIGVKTIGKAGYDPFAAARFLTPMAQFRRFPGIDDAPRQAAGLSWRRIRRRLSASQFAEKAARQFGAPGRRRGRSRPLPRWHRRHGFRRRPGQGFVRDRAFIHPGLAIGFTVPEGFVIDNTAEAVLATGVDGTALRFDAVGLAQGTDLSEYLKSGWINGLDETSIRSFSVNGLQAASAEARAKGWFFQIAVIQAGGAATYRFIFANETRERCVQAGRGRHGRKLPSMTAAELASLKALHIHVVDGGGRRHRGDRWRGGCGASTGRANFSARSTISSRRTRIEAGHQAEDRRRPIGLRRSSLYRGARGAALREASPVRGSRSGARAPWKCRGSRRALPASRLRPCSRRSRTMRSSRSLSTVSAERSQLVRRSVSICSPTVSSGSGDAVDQKILPVGGVVVFRLMDRGVQRRVRRRQARIHRLDVGDRHAQGARRSRRRSAGAGAGRCFARGGRAGGAG